MAAEIAPEAWIIDDTGFPKQGRSSVAVARQYCGALGKVGNCQIGVSVNAVTDEASCPLDWRLFVPEEWDADAERRAKAHVPDDVRHVPKWQLALDMIDELRGWGLVPPVIGADGAMARSPSSAKASRPAASTTSSRSRPAHRRSPSMSGVRARPIRASVARRSRAIARSPTRCAIWRVRPAMSRPSRSPGAKARAAR
jgi:hypothetical protein